MTWAACDVSQFNEALAFGGRSMNQDYIALHPLTAEPIISLLGFKDFMTMVNCYVYQFETGISGGVKFTCSVQQGRQADS